MRKAILIKNAVETLGFFSEQMAERFRELGVETYFVDYDRLAETVHGIRRFAEPEHTVLVTFNFIGLSGEEVFLDEAGRTLWEVCGVRVFNILVDHPMYFHSKLVKEHPNLYLFCVDRAHVSYLRRFYPEYAAEFLPLAGNRLTVRTECPAGTETGIRNAGRAAEFPTESEFSIPLESAYGMRPYEVVFTANYVPLTVFSARIRAQGAEYEAFYRGILEDLLENPAQSVDAVFGRHITEELGNLTGEELRGAMAGCAFLDMYARSLLRGEMVRGLLEAGIKIHVFGADWDKLPLERLSAGKRENLIWNGKMINSSECARAVANAQIALNVLPWFRDGAHDRIFTAMLQKTAVLTDESRFLREAFSDGVQLAFYAPGDTAAAAERIRELLVNPEETAQMAERGRAKAAECHTWGTRAETLFSRI